MHLSESPSPRVETLGGSRRVIIIGSGPSGYTAALYAARASLSPLVFEGAVTGGGALMNTTEVENFPGFPDGVMGPDLMARLRRQAERFGAELIADDVVSVDLTMSPKIVRTSTQEFSADAVILAMGSGYRTLGVSGEDELSGRGVSWCATCDGFFFRDQHIAVVGGGDSAVEEATFLTRFASKVSLLVRGSALRASKVMQERAFQDPKLEILLNTAVTAINGEDRVTSLTIARSGQSSTLDATGLFVAIGHDPRSELVAGQVDVDPSGYVITRPNSTATSIDGVFAAGDVVDHQYRQAITAAGSGCSAALDTERYLAARQSERNSGRIRATADPILG